MSWFPGGTKLLVNGPAGNGVWGIWTLAPVGGELRKLQDTIGDAALSPDGSRIAFVSEQGVWQMGPNGEQPAPLFAIAAREQVRNLVWSPDGRWLTYLRRVGQT